MIKDHRKEELELRRSLRRAVRSTLELVDDIMEDLFDEYGLSGDNQFMWLCEGLEKMSHSVFKQLWEPVLDAEALAVQKAANLLYELSLILKRYPSSIINTDLTLKKQEDALNDLRKHTGH